ncbi:MAG: hypothetical protein FWC95_08550, partial [Defluviitaleaceae bacterium]|nr:hypothetical protein [Defluviitaleaceae bacterium]
LVIVRTLIGWILGWIPLFGSLASGVATVVMIVVWIGLTVLAWKGIKIKVPIIGDACWSYVNANK